VGENAQVNTSTAFASSRGGGSGGGNSEARDTIVKALMILIFPIGLWVFEGQNLKTLKERTVALQAEVAALEIEVQAKNKEAEAVKDVEAQARELEDKLKLFKLLSRLRLREVKTLDFMQTSIPERVWLKILNYEADKEKFEAGRFNFQGRAMTTDDLTEFVKRLEESAYLNEVIVIKNQEVMAQNKSVTRDFQFTAQVEVAN
jgi:Tfp pilus assembly protein PilN